MKIDFKYISNLTPGDLIGVVQYGGSIQAGVFTGISKLGTVQFIRVYEEKMGWGELPKDRIQGSNLDRRTVKLNPADMPNGIYTNYKSILLQLNIQK